MKTFSEELREARKDKGLTLEELAASTKISYKVLRAIETGDFDVLPQTYIKGFLRTYAHEVGLDATEVVKKYEAHRKVTADFFSQSKMAEKSPSRKSSWYLWGGCIAVLILLFVGIRFLKVLNEMPEQVRSSDEETTDRSSPLDEHAIQVRVDEDDIQQPSSEELSNEQDTGEDVEAEGQLPVQSVPPGIEVFEEGQHEAATTLDPTGLTLVAQAVSDTWVRVQTDGIRCYEGIMKVGTTATWKADSLFELNIGKADGVRLVLNGQALGELGDVDKVVAELVLNKDGIVTKTLR